MGLALLQFFFFKTLVQNFFLGFFFCLKVEQINFFFFFFKFEGVPNTKKIKKKNLIIIYIFFFSGQGVPTIDKRAIIYIYHHTVHSYIFVKRKI